MGSQSSLGSRPRRGSTDGKPKRQSKLQYVLETLSACSLFVMSQRPRGAGTPHPHPIQLPSCVGIIYRKLIFGRVGGKAWRQSVSPTDIGRFPSCLEATNNNKSQYLALMKCWPLFWALYPNRFSIHNSPKGHAAAAAAAKSLQSCLTLCDPIDGSPPGSPVPGILQARTLEWVAIAFSNAWKLKVKVKSLSRIRLLVTPWTAAH